MKISIVTVCFNAVNTIETTLKSVVAQSYLDIEYIIVDAASTDGTVAVIDHFRGSLAAVISEPDNGIYDGMNKGIAIANGEVIGFINADDFYPTPEVLASIAKVFEDPDVQACYGDLCYVGQNNPLKIIRYWKSSEFSQGNFKSGWCPPHPTFFVRRKIYERYGGFNIDYKIASDFELMLRFLEVHKIRTTYIPEVLVHMRMGGTTNKSIKNIIKQNRDILLALKSHNLRASVWRLLGNKLFSRGLQFFKRPKTLKS